MLISNSLHRWLLGGCAAACLGLTGPPASTQVRASIAQPSTQQLPASGRALLLRDALLRVMKQRRIEILFDERIVANKRTSTAISFTSGSVERVLDELLAGSGLVYKRLPNNTYIITERPNQTGSGGATEADPAITGSATSDKPSGGKPYIPAPTPTAPLSPPMAALDRTLTGRVTSETGEGLPGVSVLVRASQRGTTTDSDGRFRLNVPDAEPVTLVFSFVGYLSQEVSVGNRTEVNMKLTPDDKTLKEVVVVGYGSQQKKELSTAVVSISGKDFKDFPVATPGQAIAAKLPGVSVQQASGEPGLPPVIRIRGLGSLGASNQPLYVVDGYPLNNATNFNSINPADIESIDVLKDAAAAAIYGSRGGNGVVIVTTKRGKAGKTQFTLNAYTGLSQLSKKIDMLNATQYAEFAKEARTNSGQTFPAVFNDPTQWAGTDWQSEVFRKARIQNYQLTAGGGTENLRYTVSGSYYGEEGILKGTNFERLTLRSNIDANLTPKLKLGLNLAPTFSVNQRQATSGPFNAAPIDGGPEVGSATFSSLLMPPNIPVRVANGDYGMIGNTPFAGSFVNPAVNNPLNQLENYQDKTRTYQLLSNLFLQYQILENLTFRTSLGSELISTKRDIYLPPTVATRQSPTANLSTPVLEGINASSFNELNMNWLWENTLTYSRQFLKNHNLTALAGYSAQKNAFERNTLAGRNGTYTTDQIQYLTASSDLMGGAFKTANSLVSAFARLTYDYKGKYLFSVASRRDGSSRFGANNRYANFPSASAAWRISEEGFMKGISWLSELKLRASYGVTGNYNIGDFTWLATMGQANYNFGAGTGTRVFGFQPVGFSNPDLTWETNRQTDLGLEVGLLRDRIYVTADYYNRQTEGLINSRPLPGVVGYTNSVVTNIGNIENKGIELGITSRNVVKGAFQWTTQFNISRNRNNVVSLVNDRPITYTPLFGWNDVIRVVPGRPLGDFYGYQVEGVFKNQEEVTAGPQWRVGSQPGDLKFRDANGDGRITEADIIQIGNAQPDFIYGMTNEWRYKAFDLTMVLQGVQGGEIINGSFRLLDRFSGEFNSRANALNRWRSPSDPGDGMTPRAASITTGNNTAFSSRFMYDASFLRVRNVTVGYMLPTTLAQRVRLNNARLYVSGQNLLTFTKYPGWNPEANNTGGNGNGESSTILGVDFATYPLSRTFTLGLNASF